MRWVLIRPLHPSPYYDPELQEPLGLQYLAASLRSAGHAVLLLDGALQSLDTDRLARRAVAFEPDTVGFSLMTAAATTPAADIVRRAQQMLHQPTPTHRAPRWLAGGHFVSTEPTTARRLFPAEMTLITHEGERTVLELSCEDLRGADGAASIIHGRPIEELDALPDPARPFIDTLVRRGQAINLQGSRGCSGVCRFCASPALRPNGVASWRGRSPTRLAAEMAHLQRQHGAQVFNFVDEDFLGPGSGAEARAFAIAAAISGQQLHLTFGIQARPQTLTQRAAQALTGAGLRHVFLGVESDDARDLARWGRAPTPDAWQTIAMLRRLQVDVHVGVMLFHPRASLAGIRSFATKLRDHGLLSYHTAISRMMAIPGSVFARGAHEQRLLDPDAVGPQPLPFADPSVASLYDGLRHAVAPLGPAAMHALCAVPDLHGRIGLTKDAAERYRQLRGVLTRLDMLVARMFFSLLDAHEQSPGSLEHVELIRDLRTHAWQAASNTADDLVTIGILSDAEQLRHAMQIDAPDLRPAPSVVAEACIG
jgi:hypothetical protein